MSEQDAMALAEAVAAMSKKDAMAMASVSSGLEAVQVREPQAENLWQRALDTLGDELRQSLDVKAIDKTDILAKLLATAEEKRHVCQIKCWKVKVKGKDIVVRDVLEKIIESLIQFKCIEQVISQVDSASVALPLACVRLLLKAAVGDFHVFASTVSGLDTVSHLITRYTIFERAYMQRNAQTCAVVEPLLTTMYAEILTFLAKAKKYFERPTGVRVMKSVLVAFQSEEDKQLANIASLEAKLAALASASDGVLLNSLPTLEVRTRRIADQMAEYAKIIDDSRHRQIVDWLSPVPFKAHHERHSERRLPNSGEWLLNRREYLDWRTCSSCSIFLLHGMAGSGKTMLASVVIDSLRGNMPYQDVSQASAGPVLVAHFYCSKSFSEAKRRDPAEILGSILRQLSMTADMPRSIHGFVLREYEKREIQAKQDGFDVPRLDTHECVDLILTISRSNPVSIIIDAIDELQPDSRYELVKCLGQIVSDSANVVKVFVTSRNDNQIQALLSDAFALCIEAQDNSTDVAKFVHDQIARAMSSYRLMGGHLTPELKATLSKALLDCAGECFQLVIWQIERLCQVHDERDFQQAMLRLSEDTLERLYADVLSKIRAADAHATQIATCAISLLLSLREPLPPLSFLAALSLLDQKTDAQLQLEPVLRICFNLIVIDSKLNLMRFAHTSIHEYLEQQNEYSLEKTESVISKLCIRSCLHNSSVELETSGNLMDNFYHYAVMYWPEHCKHVILSGYDDGELMQLVTVFVADEGVPSLPFRAWLEDAKQLAEVLPHNHPQRRPLIAVANQEQSLIFTICIFGLSELLHLSSFDVNLRNGLGHTGLYLACACGYQRIARLLLDRGADVDAGRGRFGSPLQAASFAGHTTIVEMLLAHGANMSTAGPLPPALRAAIDGNQETTAVLLLSQCSDLIDQGQYDEALHAAAQRGLVRVVEELDRTYSSTFAKPAPNKHSAIGAAIRKGHGAALERFMRRLPDPKSDCPADAIALAAQGGHHNMIHLLLAEGLDIEFEGQFGRPLRAASLFGHEAMVQTLIEGGAMVDATSSSGNALEAAALHGHCAIVKALLHQGANVDIEGGQHGTPLQAAVYQGHLSVANVLIEAGANMYQAGAFKSALHAAVYAGQETLVQLLLDWGFDCGADELRDLHDGRPGYSKRPPVKCSMPNCSMPKKEKHLGLPDPLLTIAAEKGQVGTVQHILSRVHKQIRPQSLTRIGHDEIIPSVPYKRTFSTWKRDPYDIQVNVLRPGCRKSHVHIVESALNMLGQEASSLDMRAIHDEALRHGCLHDSDSVVEYMTGVGELDAAALLEAVMLACEHGSVRSLHVLLSKFKADGLEPFPQGANQFMKEGLLFLRRRPREEWSLHDALHSGLYLAALNGHSRMIRTLMTLGVPLNVRLAPRKGYMSESSSYETCLQDALRGFASEHMSRRSLAWGMPTEPNWEPRHSAVMELLECGADAHMSDHEVDSLLIFAVQFCPEQIVCLIIDKRSSSISTHSQTMLAWQAVLQRQLPAEALVAKLFEAGTRCTVSELHTMMGKALEADELQCHSTSDKQHIQHILKSGPGEVIRSLLKRFSMQVTKHQTFARLLVLAAAVNDSGWIDLLLERGMKVNQPLDAQQGTRRCRRGKLENCTDPEQTAFQCAASSGFLELSRRLLELGADIAPEEQGLRNLLRNVVQGHHVAIFDLLVEHGVDVSKHAEPALLTTALESPSSVMVRTLIAAGVALSDDDAELKQRLLARACEKGDRDMVMVLLDHGCEAYSSKFELENLVSPLHVACSKGHEPVVRLLIERGADVNYQAEDDQGRACMTPLQTAVQARHSSITNLLVSAGANVDHHTRHGTALTMAVRAGDSASARVLLLAGATMVDTSGRWNALADACRCTSGSLVRFLLRNMPAGTGLGEAECSLLREAARSLNLYAVRVLLQHGLDAVGHDEKGSLLEAVMRGLADKRFDAPLEDILSRSEGYCDDDGVVFRENYLVGPWSPSRRMNISRLILRMLLDQGANPNATTTCGATILQLACLIGGLSMVQDLLDAGADVNASNDRFGTALHLAVRVCRNHLLVRKLLDHGANLSLECGPYGSPLTAYMASWPWKDVSASKDTARLLLECGKCTAVSERDILAVMKGQSPISS